MNVLLHPREELLPGRITTILSLEHPIGSLAVPNERVTDQRHLVLARELRIRIRAFKSIDAGLRMHGLPLHLVLRRE